MRNTQENGYQFNSSNRVPPAFDKLWIRYFFFWPWWIIKLSLRSLTFFFHSEFLIPSFIAAFLSLFVSLAFISTAWLMEMKLPFFVGLIYGILPLIWVFGEISRVRRGRDFPELGLRISGTGYEAVRWILGYILIFILLLLLEVSFNLLASGLPPGNALPALLLGLNTFLSMAMLVVFVIIVLSLSMMPPHLVYRGNINPLVDRSLDFLDLTGRKFFRYAFAHLPGLFFAGLISVLPILFVGLALLLTLNIKSLVREGSFFSLKMNREQRIVKGEPIMLKSSKTCLIVPDSERNPNYSIPGVVRMKQKADSLIQLASSSLEVEKIIYRNKMDSLKMRVEEYLLSVPADRDVQRAVVDSIFKTAGISFENWEKSRRAAFQHVEKIEKETEVFFIQLPLLYFYLVLLVSFFGAIILAGPLAYLGNLFYSLYDFGEVDRGPSTFRLQD